MLVEEEEEKKWQVKKKRKCVSLFINLVKIEFQSNIIFIKTSSIVKTKHHR